MPETDLDTEFMFQEKVTDYVKMSKGTFLELLKLTLKPETYNTFLLKLERVADQLLKELPENEIVYNNMDEVIAQGMTQVKITTEMFTLTQLVSMAKLQSESIDQHLLLTSGNKYCGSISKQLKPDGQGVLTTADNDNYLGEFSNGEITGKGTFVWSNGNSYEGDFIDGQMEGNGIYTWKEEGSEYHGQFINGQFQGKGEYITKNGCKYKGNFEKDEYKGNGIFIWENGDCYEGEFADDKIFGRGILTTSLGVKYEGEFKGTIDSVSHASKGGYSGYIKTAYCDGHLADGQFTGSISLACFHMPKN